MADNTLISADAWAKGIGYCILASAFGGASKLGIRKSWLMVQYDDDDVSLKYYPEKLGEKSSLNNVHQSYSTDQDEHSNCNNYYTMAHTQVRDDVKTRRRRRTYIAAICLRYSGIVGMSTIYPAIVALAMNYASPSILAPFSGLTLVWVILFSECFNRERPHAKQITAACLIILGQVIVGVFGDHTNDDGITLRQM